MKLLRILSFVAVFSATSMTSSHVHAELGTLQKTFQEPDAATAEPPAMCRLQTRRQQCTLNHYEDTQKLTQEITEVVLERLRTGVVRDGQPVYVGACGNDYYFSCEDRIRSIVEMVVRESKILHVDPWVIAAQVWHETRYNPFAVSHLGTRGVMQLHPRNSRFNHVRFLHGSDHFRRQCKRQIGYCQEPVVHEGVLLMRHSMLRCSDSTYQALTMYNSGRCHMRGNTYATTILADARSMRTEELTLARQRIYGTVPESL